MKFSHAVIVVAIAATGMLAGSARAADTNAATPAAGVLAPNQIYGAQLMTPEERSAFRAKMQSARTAEERRKLRSEHHQEMQARAKEKGIVLPEVPPMRGKGMRGGAGMMRSGQGMGPGQGMDAVQGVAPPPAAKP